MLRGENVVEDWQFLQEVWRENDLDLFLKQGFATRGPQTFRPKTSSLSVPIIADERAVGCLSIIWVTKAMEMERAVERYAAALQQTAIEISAGIL